ncbi:MAG: reverse gyrase [Sulfolobales archaeon]
MIIAYESLCPACRGDIDSYRLSLGLPCRVCLSRIPEGLEAIEDPFRRASILVELLRRGSGDYSYIASQEEEFSDFHEFFRGLVGYPMWSIQRAWARRLLSRSSLVLTAPTGSGKSTLVQVFSLYMASRGYRVYMVVPTRELLRQSLERISGMLSKAGLDIEVIAYDASSNARAREELIRAISSNTYDILLTTSALISRRRDIFAGLRFDVIVADDLDSLVKSSKNLERILEMLGVDRGEVELAAKIAAKKYELAGAKAIGNPEKVGELREELEVLRAELASSLSRKRIGQLVVSTATGKSWGIKSKILREILGFEVGGILEYIRNIVDAYTLNTADLAGILRRIGGGTIIFISRGYNGDISDLVERLREEGLRIGIYRSGGRDIKRFLSGELDYIVGKASFYGALVRGLDEPLRIRNAVFIGVPKHIIPLRSFLADLRSLALFYRQIGFEDRYREIYSIIRRLSPSALAIIKKILGGRVEPSQGFSEIVKRAEEWIEDAVDHAKWVCRDGILIGGSMVICREGGLPEAVIPDPMTYIQASGRTSRIYGGGMTLGLSIVFAEGEELLSLLSERLRRYIPNISFKKLEDLDLEEVKREQDRSRRASTASIQPINVRNMLMIVESPAKARTIAALFGSRSRRLVGPYSLYEFSLKHGEDLYIVSVIATMGHIFDLSTSGGLYGVLYEGGSLIPRYGFIRRCQQCGHQYTDPIDRCPRCGSSRIRSSEDLIMVLRRIAPEYDEILIATDPDQEGEKIAWDLYLALKPYSRRILRAEFHEITRRAVAEAIASPRSISRSMIEAQIVRRLDDRFTGFSISQELQERFSMRWLGAGRVETPALSWVVERYGQYRSSMGYRLVIRVVGRRIYLFFRSRDDAEAVSKRIRDHGILVKYIARERRVIKPPPPYVTDTLLYDASSKLGISASTVMRVAQDLFETGLITYHRTDSTRVSQRGVEVAREYLSSKGLSEYLYPRSWGEGGAHEAIRPTQPLDLEGLEKAYLEGKVFWGTLSKIHMRVYDMIFRRFVASQMREDEVEVCIATLDLGGLETHIEGICSNEFSLNNIYQVIPEFPEEILSRGVGGIIYPDAVEIARGSTVRLLTSGELVRIMKERGVGRPSTYAKAIENNKRHGYIVESKRGYLIPTKLGISILDYLRERYPSITSEAYTRELMRIIEAVERGEKRGVDALEEIIERLIRENQTFSRLYSNIVSQGIRPMLEGFTEK